ncbi:MAG: hypothetical protein R2789_11175 [Microthrixaceae bacterium]
MHTASVQDPVFVAWRQVAIAAVAARLQGPRCCCTTGYLPYMLEPGGYRVGRAHQRMAFAILGRLCGANILIGEAGVGNLRPYMAHTDLPVVHLAPVVVTTCPTAPRCTTLPGSCSSAKKTCSNEGLTVLMDALDLLDATGTSYG